MNTRSWTNFRFAQEIQAMFICGQILLRLSVWSSWSFSTGRCCVAIRDVRLQNRSYEHLKGLFKQSQHVVGLTSRNIVGCNMLASFEHYVGWCWFELLEIFVQHRATLVGQQCCTMLASFEQTPNLMTWLFWTRMVTLLGIRTILNRYTGGDNAHSPALRMFHAKW